MKFSKVNLQRTKKIGAQLAVEIWMEYSPEALPEYWREAMVERGVGERKPDGTVRLTRRGRRLRAELLQARSVQGEPELTPGGLKERHESDFVAAIPAGDRGRGVSVPPGPKPWLRLTWREILQRCNADLSPALWPAHRPPLREDHDRR